MTSATSRTGLLALGVLGGAGVGLLATSSWGLRHPGLVAAVAILAFVAAWGYASHVMNRYERGHEQRADAFRIAMLAQYAPHKLHE